jgi:acyl dehydratase
MPDLSYDDIELGKEYGPYYYPLADRIVPLLDATGNQHPWYRGRSPWGPPMAPPSTLGSACMRFIDSISPIPPGVLHAKQDVDMLSGLRQDRQPIAYGRFTEKYEKRGRRWCVFEASFRDETGIIIGHGRTTLAFPDKVETDDEPAGDKPAPPERKAELKPITRTITQEQITAYSEDTVNAQRGTSVHTDEAVAKKAGFERTLAPGMMAADHISEMMTEAFGKNWFEYSSLKLAFTHPILCGDTVTASGRIRDDKREGAVLRRTYEVWAENQDGQTVATGAADSLIIPE